MIFQLRSLGLSIAAPSRPTIYAMSGHVQSARYINSPVITLYLTAFYGSHTSPVFRSCYASSFVYGVDFPLICSNLASASVSLMNNLCETAFGLLSS